MIPTKFLDLQFTESELEYIATQVMDKLAGENKFPYEFPVDAGRYTKTVCIDAWLNDAGDPVLRPYYAYANDIDHEYCIPIPDARDIEYYMTSIAA